MSKKKKSGEDKLKLARAAYDKAENEYRKANRVLAEAGRKLGKAEFVLLEAEEKYS
jgi:hypothetical protein